MTAPSIAVLVVNYGSPRLLVENYAPLRLESVGARLIVVDNRRTEAESAQVAALAEAHGWELLANDGNPGFGSGMNSGAERARELGCDVIILANPDLAMTESVVATLAAAVRESPDTAVSPRILADDGSVWFGGASVLLEEGRTTTRPGTRSDLPHGWLSGACVAVHRDLWDRAGGFSEEYFLYWEDVDFSWRITRAGGRLLVRDDIEVVHAVGGTQEGRGKSPTYVYWNTRNRLVFAAEHLDARQRRRWRRGSIPYARAVMLRGGRREWLRRAVPLTAAAVGGTIAGLRVSRRGAERKLAVLQSFPGRGSETNPYLLQLVDSMSAEVETVYFSWPAAFLGRYDLFHVHWPERLIRGTTPVRTLARQALLPLLLLRLAATGTPVVRTLHNLASHEGEGRLERALLALLERRTAAYLRLNPFTPAPTDAPIVTVKHGDYRPWFAGHAVPAPVPGRLLFFGRVRPYKGVGELIAAYTALPDAGTTLRIVGKAGTADEEDRVRSTATDPRITLQLGYASDADLAREIGEAELVVLPYRAVHNSGAAILALSLDRPVLLPRTEVVGWLADEAGDGWVHQYEPPLTADRLSDALAAARRRPEGACALP
ncbi:MAG TPA: glycosyltransferase, partial [Naasia sp.]